VATNPPSGLTEVKNVLIQILFLFLSCYIDVIPSIKVYDIFNNLSLIYTEGGKNH
jgi:hypothetical protein